MKFKLSGTSKIPKSKSATFNYKDFETKKIDEVIEYINTHAIIPCSIEDGHRLRNNVTEIYEWIRLDVDVKGEAKKIDKALKKVMYIKKPSTSHKKNPYKWHYLIPITNVSQNYDAYKLQYYNFLAEHNIDLTDKSLASVVQNTNPMGEEGVELTVFNKGKVWKAPDMKAPKKVKLKEKHSDISKGDVKKALKKLDPNMEYVEWLNVGFALYDWCPKKGFKLYDKWSSKGKSYDGTTKDKWEDYGKNASGDVTVGTLLHMAYGEKVDPVEGFKKEQGSVFNMTKKEKKKKAKKKKERDKGFSLLTLPNTLNQDMIRERGDQITLFPSVITKGMHSFLFGEAGSNKTTVMAWIVLDVLDRFPNMVCHFWSFDASQNHEQSIYDYADSTRLQLSVASTSEDYYNYYDTAISKGEDMGDIIIVIDTFKFVTANVNDKNANKKALHYIKELTNLGATVISLGHTNKDGMKQSGTAEIEQDSEALLRIDRAVDEFSKEVVLTISKAGRCRFACEGVTFKSKPRGDGYKYLYTALTSMKISKDMINLSDKNENKKEDDKKHDKDALDINVVREVIASIDRDSNGNVEASESMVSGKCSSEYGMNHKKSRRILLDYLDKEWIREVSENSVHKGRRPLIYALVKKTDV